MSFGDTRDPGDGRSRKAKGACIQGRWRANPIAQKLGGSNWPQDLSEGSFKGEDIKVNRNDKRRLLISGRQSREGAGVIWENYRIDSQVF